MGSQDTRCRDGFRRTWVARVLLLALVLRALIPAGFMPDLGAMADGSFKVVICSAAGTKLVTLDAEGNPLPDTATQHDGEACAFSGMATYALTPVVADMAVVYDASADHAAKRPVVVLPPARAGPVLGSRAPPIQA